MTQTIRLGDLVTALYDAAAAMTTRPADADRLVALAMIDMLDLADGETALLDLPNERSLS
jgi:hypothetical protein